MTRPADEPQFAPGDVVIATFQPRQREGLRTGGAAWEGKRCRWVAAWALPCGRFAGQLAWVPWRYARDPELSMLGWVPTEDLVAVVPAGTIEFEDSGPAGV
jgi:hypothetical protein